MSKNQGGPSSIVVVDWVGVVDKWYCIPKSVGVRR